MLNLKNKAIKIQKVKLSIINYNIPVESPEILNNDLKAYTGIINLTIEFKLKNQDDNIFEIEKFIINEYFSSVKSEEISKKLQKSKEEVFKIEGEIVRRIIGKIVLDKKEEGKKENLGSLYSLFDHYLFNIHLLMCYLDKKENTGIIDTLVNLIYKKFIHESLFYLPQIW